MATLCFVLYLSFFLLIFINKQTLSLSPGRVYEEEYDDADGCKMAMSAAERARKYRENRDKDPTRREAFLQKQRQRYQKDKLVGIRKPVASMTQREHRQQRRLWRKHQKDRRQRLQKMKNLSTLTPPHSPEDENLNNASISRQQTSAKKHRNRQKAVRHREIVALKKELSIVKKRAALYRKRWQREKDQQYINKKVQHETPRSKTRKLLTAFSSKRSKKTVRKALVFHNSLLDELRKKYSKGTNNVKQSISKIATGKIMKKYKLLTYARNEIGLPKQHGQRIRKRSLTTRIEQRIQHFYERDDISRTVPGVKQTVTRRKQKRQKRVLTDDLVNIHKKFLEENTDVKVSYTSFCRKRPFWVIQPNETDRDTCACRIHENMSLLVAALSTKQLLPTDKLNQLVSLLVCDIKKKNCMYGMCGKCKDRQLILQTYDQNELIKWQQWQTKTEKREIKKETKEVTLTVKEDVEGTMGALIDKFKAEMVRFKKHIFNLENQMSYYRQLQKSLGDDELMIHVDFAENYICKSAKEIQGAHYGASKRQITLHTGVYYSKESDVPVSFCTVSDSLQHSPAGIWAYLNPLLDDIEKIHPSIKTIHFFSDGPFTQYRQKSNFYFFSTELAKRGFKSASWNFHEAGHGKGAPDGVGAALKRTADMRVLHGSDIHNASAFIKELKQSETSIVLYEVTQEEVDCKEKSLPSLKTVPGTSKLHQVLTTSPGVLFYRDVSCSCSKDSPHGGHEFTQFTYVDAANNTSEKRTNEQKGSNQYNRETVSHSNNVSRKRKQFYKDCLDKLAKCKTFESLKRKCEEIDSIQEEHFNIENSQASSQLKIDENARKIFPDDFHYAGDFCPVTVKGDGNCLPYSGSVIAFGDEDHGNEIRIRIIIEQTLHKDLYLSQNYLQNGLNGPSSHNLAKLFALYSDEYIQGSEALTDKLVSNIYEKEVMKIVKPNTFMGIWQVFALASVLKTKLFSVYPKLGNVNVRRDLHRLIEPRICNESKGTAFIMWTSTRGDMTKGHWVPNHFVPVINREAPVLPTTDHIITEDTPIEVETVNETKLALERIRLQRRQLLELRKNKKLNTSGHNLGPPILQKLSL